MKTRFLNRVRCAACSTQLLVFLLTLPASAQDQFRWGSYGEGATLLEYTGSDSVVDIPSTIFGRPVTRIDDFAFSGTGVTNVTSVTIPNTVTTLGTASFAACHNLKEVYFEGNAPVWTHLSLLIPPFGMLPAIAYYLPGTTGWGETYYQLPTRPWELRIPASNPSFDMQTNGFGFRIQWPRDRLVIVEACTNSLSASWSQVGALNGLSYFSDPDWTNYLAKFYRLRSL